MCGYNSVLRTVRCSGWAIGVGAILACTGAGAQAIKYNQPIVVPTPQYPYSGLPVWATSFVAGDLDGDGKTDLLYLFTGTGGGYAGNVLDAPLFNNGDETFLPPGPNTGTSFNQGSSVVQVIAPVVKGGRSTQVSVASVAGDATVIVVPYTASKVVDTSNIRSSAFTLSGGSKAKVTAMAAADLNGDGANDLIVEDGPNGNLYVLINDGTGIFTAKTFLTLPEACSQLLVDDFDLDGTPDIAVLGADGRVFVELSDGKGGVKATRLYHIPGGSAYSMLYADINGDGLKDLVFEGTNAVLYAITGTPGYGPNEGSGTTGLVVQGPAQTNQGGHLVAIADLNGDGIADIVTATPAGVLVLLGKGSFNYQTSLAYNAGPGRTSYALADFNNDGHLDLAVDSPEGIAILYGLGNGTFQTGNTFDTGQPAFSVALGDFRGTGVLDAVVATGVAQAQLMEGDGTGNFVLTNFAGLSNAGATTWSHVVAGDFDGDGKLDVGMSADGPVEKDLGPCCAVPYPASDNGMSVMFGDGTGRFEAPVAEGGASSGAHYGMLAVADLNGDGVSDLVNYSAMETDGYDGVAGLQMSIPQSTTFGLWTDGYLRPYQQIATGYLMSGRTSAPDVVVESLGSSLSFSLQKNDGKGNYTNGQQTFTLPQGVAVMTPGSSALPATGLYPSALALTDVDGDGNGDLLVLYHNLAADPTQPNNTTANLLYVFWGNGDGTFYAEPSILTLSRNDYLMTVADVDGDGNQDLVLSDGYLVTVLLGKAGKGPLYGFAQENHYLAGMGINALAVASVTGPGSVDIVAANGGAVLSAGVVNRGMPAVNAEVNTGGLTVLGPATSVSLPALSALSGTLTASPEPSVYGTSITLTATLTPPADGVAPGGTVAFSIDGTQVGTGTLTNGAASFVVQGSVIAADITNATFWDGAHTLTGAYSGDGNYSAATFRGNHTVVGQPTLSMLADLVTSIYYGQEIGYTNGINAQVSASAADPSTAVPGTTLDDGNLLVYIDGNLVCTLPYGVPQACPDPPFENFPVGQHSTYVMYSGNDYYAPSNSAVYTVTIAPDPTTTTVTSSLNPSTFGQAVTFSAAIGDQYHVAEGTVSFLDGTTVIGSGTVNGQGVATFTTASLTVGTHPINAMYAPQSNNFLASSGALLNGQVVDAAVPPPPPPPAGPVTFTLAVNPSSISVGVGNSVAVQVVVTALNGFSQPVKLGCTGLPNETTCTFVQSLIGPGGGTTGLIVSPAAPHTCGSSVPDFIAPNVKAGLGGMALSVMALFGLRRRRRLMKGLALLLALWVLPMLSGCGSGCKDFGTEPTNYTFTVTGVSTGSPVVSLTQAVKMNVHL